MMVNLPELPELVLLKLFEYLSYKDRITCGLVCSKWRSVSKNYKQKTLFLHFDFYPFNRRYNTPIGQDLIRCSSKNDQQLIGYCNSFKINHIDFIEHQLTKLYFKNLKKLIIYKLDQPYVKIKNFDFKINYFNDLEYLELNGIILKNNTILELKKLRTLSLKEISFKELELNTPNLINLICCANLNKIKFIYPNRLENLELKNEQDNFRFNYKFINLSHLNLYDTSKNVANDFLSNLPNLKELIFFSNDMKIRFEELKRQKLIYCSNNLKLIPFGFDIIVKQPDEIDNQCAFIVYEFYLESLIKNYSSLDKITWPIYIDYSSLMNKFKNFSNDFFNKFSNFYTIFVGQSTNHNNLIEFLKNCKYIHRLVLHNSNLKIEFYHQLSTISLNKLEIVEQSICNLNNYDFLSKLTINELHFELPYLTNQQIISALQNEYLKILKYIKGNLNMTINCNDNLELEINDSPIEIENLDDLVLKLKEHCIL